MTEQQQTGEQDRFRFQLVYLVPILASIIFGLACGYLLLPQPQSSAPPATPISGSSPSAAVGNAIYFVVLVAISATVFYLLLRRRSKKIIRGLIVVAMTAASLLLSLYYLNALLAYFPVIDTLLVLVALSLIITALFDVAVFRLGSIPKNVAVLAIGGALGIFFGFAIPLWSAVLILVFLAVYDVFAVYRGPVGKIAQLRCIVGCRTGGKYDRANPFRYTRSILPDIDVEKAWSPRNGSYGRTRINFYSRLLLK